MFTNLLRSTLTLTLSTAATAVVVAFSAAPVQAAQTPRTINIHTQGIDLTSPAGRALVDARVRRAARAVCGANDPQAWRTAPAIRACIQTASAQAQPRLDALAAASRDARTALAADTAETARP